jgi:hypothetical protein
MLEPRRRRHDDKMPSRLRRAGRELLPEMHSTLKGYGHHEICRTIEDEQLMPRFRRTINVPCIAQRLANSSMIKTSSTL